MMGKKLLRLIRLSGFIVLMMVFAFVCSSCSQFKEIKQSDPFRRLYEAQVVSRVDSPAATAVLPSLSMSCLSMPLPLFCRILSDKFGVGLVYSEKLSDRTITAEFKETDLQSVLNVISRQLAVDIVRVGNTFYVGSLRPEDRGVLVRRVLGYDQSSLTGIVTAILSERGKSNVMPNSVVVATDHESVLRRLAEMLDYLDTVDTGTWIVQLYFVTLRKDALQEAGLGVTSSGTLSYNISENRIDMKDFKLDGLFNLSANSSFADIFASPMLLVRDGCSATWQDGERVPVPRKTVSDYGTVSTTGFDYIDVGFIVNASVQQGKVGGRLTLDIEMSDIKSYVEYAPVTSRSLYKMDVDLVPGRVYLVGELSKFKELDTQKSVLTFGGDRGKSVLQVWAQLYKISGTVSEPYDF